MKDQLKKIAKGAAIAALAAGLVTACEMTLGMDFGAWTPTIQAVAGIVLNAAKVLMKL